MAIPNNFLSNAYRYECLKLKENVYQYTISIYHINHFLLQFETNHIILRESRARSAARMQKRTHNPSQRNICPLFETTTTTTTTTTVQQINYTVYCLAAELTRDERKADYPSVRDAPIQPGCAPSGSNLHAALLNGSSEIR